uniref:Uncharacterized protein n=1 Tax=Hyaloperonospora arabidopsidis (strain Emoy2) TaxID=559515 RepID=M4BZG2_HYAAE
MASLKLSGLLNRFTHVDDIPLWQFARRKKLRVRMIRQSRQHPSVMYVYHTPLLRRTVLQDVLPSSLQNEVNGRKKKEEEKKSDLIAIRPFGPLRNRDFAQELISHGYAECIPENLENYDNGTASRISRRLKNGLRSCSTASGTIGKQTSS